jgi:hypothetical protein
VSDPKDHELGRERVRRHAELLASAVRLERRAIELILKANEIRKLAAKTAADIEQEKTACPT